MICLFHSLYQKAQESKDWYSCIFKASETKILDEEELKDGMYHCSICKTDLHKGCVNQSNYHKDCIKIPRYPFKR